jgi:hypothetical protein
MTVEADIYSLITGDATLTALIGTRVYPNTIEQNATLPVMVYRRISAERITAMHQNTGTVRARYQFDVYDDQYTDGLRPVVERLRTVLDRSNGGVSDSIEHIFVLNETEYYDDATELYRVSIDFEIIYGE